MIFFFPPSIILCFMLLQLRSLTAYRLVSQVSSSTSRKWNVAVGGMSIPFLSSRRFMVPRSYFMSNSWNCRQHHRRQTDFASSAADAASRLPSATTVIRRSSQLSMVAQTDAPPSATSSPLKSLLLQSPSTSTTQFVFVGGKGGVGKTSSSSAVSIALSDAGLRTLIVSTDPAHSLGDALDVNLKSGKVVPISTESNLWGLEIDVDAALKEFKETANDLDVDSLAASLGIPKDILESLGLNDLASIFANPPPGIDEIVALTKIFKYADETLPNGSPRFQRIVIDTAPTGHTIRLLQLPEFLNSVTGKVIKFRAKLMSAVNSFKSLFGGGDSSSSSPGSDVGGILGRLEGLQENVARVKQTLQDPKKTQFVVVTIPTTLAVAESKRLVTSLQQEGIRVSGIICNQIVSPEAGPKYVQTRSVNQRKCIDQLSSFTKTMTQGDPRYGKIEITEVPYVDTEVTGIYGLRFFSNIAHVPKAQTATNPIDSRKLTIFGGKGGVGKTTSAASWGVLLSDHGLKTLVISTDPAHSLGDAFQEKLTGVPRLLDQNAGSGGQLWAMEIDPDAALGEFRELIQGALGKAGGGGSGRGSGTGDRAMGGFGGAMGMPDLKGDLADMLSGVNDPPPGTDEVVALTKVVTYMEDGLELPSGQRIKFDRIVLDTAPTGHTLRMLQLPDFLQELIRKLKKIREKTGSLSGMMGMMGAGGGSESGSSETGESEDMQEGERKLEKFERRMERLEELLHNPRESEFSVVTIPTEVASAETMRLLQTLFEDSIGLRRVIINQVIPRQGAEGASAEAVETASNAYLNRLRQGQQASITELQRLSESANCELIKVPYFDMEVRTVYGLRVVGAAIFNNPAAGG